jgi:hypothetical protein
MYGPKFTFLGIPSCDLDVPKSYEGADVIILGATARLASFIDPGRLTFGSAEADQQSQIAGRAYGAGTNASKYLLALYDKRLSEEARKLNDRNPIRIHFTR